MVTVTVPLVLPKDIVILKRLKMVTVTVPLVLPKDIVILKRLKMVTVTVPLVLPKDRCSTAVFGLLHSLLHCQQKLNL